MNPLFYLQRQTLSLSVSFVNALTATSTVRQCSHFFIASTLTRGAGRTARACMYTWTVLSRSLCILTRAFCHADYDEALQTT